MNRRHLLGLMLALPFIGRLPPRRMPIVAFDGPMTHGPLDVFWFWVVPKSRFQEYNSAADKDAWLAVNATMIRRWRPNLLDDFAVVWA